MEDKILKQYFGFDFFVKKNNARSFKYQEMVNKRILEIEKYVESLHQSNSPEKTFENFLKEKGLEFYTNHKTWKAYKSYILKNHKKEDYEKYLSEHLMLPVEKVLASLSSKRGSPTKYGFRMNREISLKDIVVVRETLLIKILKDISDKSLPLFDKYKIKEALKENVLLANKLAKYISLQENAVEIATRVQEFLDN